MTLGPSLHVVLDHGVIAFSLFSFVLLAAVGSVGLLLGIRRLRRRQVPDREVAGVSTITAGMLGVMGFLLALTISFAQQRYEARRLTTVTEANAIGTAWLRTGFADSAKPLSALIEAYAHVRITYLSATTLEQQTAATKQTGDLQTQIWQRAMDIQTSMPPPLAASLAAALNDMFDASLAQRFALESRAPVETSLTLLVGAVLTIGALGFQMGIDAYRPYFTGLLLLFMLSGGMTLIVDLSQPHLGYTRVESEPLEWTIQGFGTPSRP